MKTVDFTQKAPFFFKDLSIVFKNDGSLRQCKSLINIIKKNHSAKIVMAGIPKFYMRVDSAQMRQFGSVTVLVATPDLEGGYKVSFLNN